MSAIPAAPRISKAAPRHPIALRIGLVLAAVLSILSAIPAVAEIGLDGSAWDILVIYLAVSCPLIALATLVLLPFAWSGRRRPAGWIAALQLIAIIGLLPPFFLVFVDGLPLLAPISAGVTILLEVLAAWLIVHGMQDRTF